MPVAYEGNDEILICDKEVENKFLKEWFEESDRDIENYERYEDEVLGISPSVNLNTYKCN